MTKTPGLPLLTPEPYGFLYLGFNAQHRKGGPLVRDTARRREYSSHLQKTATALEKVKGVHSIRVYRARVLPPLPGMPQHDHVMLIRTETPQELEDVRKQRLLQSLNPQEILVGENAARIGETETDPESTYLLNHFEVRGTGSPIEAWKSLTQWYTTKIGIDNSTALISRDENTQFPLVNYARLPSNPPAFLLNQILRPSFFTTVRGTLKSNQMRALPGFYRLVSIT